MTEVTEVTLFLLSKYIYKSKFINLYETVSLASFASLMKDHQLFCVNGSSGFYRRKRVSFFLIPDQTQSVAELSDETPCHNSLARACDIF